ncbi:CRISPR-associated endonuclease Cas1 [Heliorestis acidaminivorans]|uniref:CRISPR-associated endonuclease Cas1 n=1 Tax=Heliorestis acidaminivorans TaxID=553427 RepID=A0A6I0ESD4_9FIRM|nr:CRISPR-associated endonuclease Cas1 [Heliorestis acidaminivorans]KAB2952695.1 CRISPR-associated endonuclease Cas1 [Heliorestis acidaminivorans]
MDLQSIIDNASGEKKHIIVSRFGTSLGKKSETLVVKEKGQVIEEHPFFQVEQVTIMTSGVSISTDVINEAIKQGIEINLLDYKGVPYAKIFTPTLSATVKTRREQLLAYNDQRSVFLAKAFVQSKLKNQCNTLKYFAKYRKTSRREVYEKISEVCISIDKISEELVPINGTMIDDIRGHLFSIEGRGAQQYWKGIQVLFDDKIDFPGRENRGANDPVNSLLNYGYAILESRILGAIIQAGLDPYAGYLHVDRPGKSSLVYDLIEEFRQPIVDRSVIALITQGADISMNGELLSDKTKQLLIEKIEKRLNSNERFDNKKYPLKAIILRQSRRIASYLRGDHTYKPFICGW